MKVILVRHAKSAYDWNRWPIDSMRPLSGKGITRQHKVAKGMVRENLHFEKVWVSPYIRAQETLDIILKYYRVNVKLAIIKELTPSGSSVKLLEQLQEVSTPNNQDTSILIVGHDPTLSELLELICGPEKEYIPNMRTSDVAVCEVVANETRLLRFYPRAELY